MTTTDVLERTYRRALQQADAMGISFADLLRLMLPDTAAELKAYVREEYDLAMGIDGQE